MRLFVLGVSLLLSLPASGAVLDDVRAALQRLEGKQPVRATLTIDQAVKSEGKYANDSTKRLATAEVRHDASGVTITIPQPLIDAGPAHEDAIGSIRTLDVVAALNYREEMLELLHGAKVESETRGMYRDRPARRLKLKLNPEPKKKRNSITIGSVKSDDRMDLWIGDDNLPLAAERRQKTSAGILFVKGNFQSSSSLVFTRAGDRLILARVESTEGGSGMGQKFDRRSVETVTVH
jgi:hypothetical protein